MIDEEALRRTLEHAFELWFRPEVERRVKTGLFDESFKMWAGQVLMNVGKPPIVYFNEEIHGVVEGRLRRSVEKGELLRFRDFSEITGVHLTTEEPNAGHLTVILYEDKWHLFLDFRYNATRIDTNLQKARRFHEVARMALASGIPDVAVENLFAAVELAAIGFLMMSPPDERILESKKHSFVQSQFSRFYREWKEAVGVFGRLSDLRPRVRYQGLEVTKSEVEALSRQVGTMIDQLEAQRPRRVKVEST